MESYGVIKEAMLLKADQTGVNLTFVEKLNPATVNGIIFKEDAQGDFTIYGKRYVIASVCRGGVFSNSHIPEDSHFFTVVYVPGEGNVPFTGSNTVKAVGDYKGVVGLKAERGGYRIALKVDIPAGVFIAKNPIE